MGGRDRRDGRPERRSRPHDPNVLEAGARELIGTQDRRSSQCYSGFRGKAPVTRGTLEALKIVRRFLALLLSIPSSAFIACESEATGPEEMHGLFDLTEVANTPLPALGAPNGDCPVLMDHGSIALDTSGRFSAMIDAGTTQCANGDSNPAYWPDAGSYRIRGDSIEFDPDGDSPTYSGKFMDADRKFLEMDHPRGTYLYARFR